MEAKMASIAPAVVASLLDGRQRRTYEGLLEYVHFVRFAAAIRSIDLHSIFVRSLA